MAIVLTGATGHIGANLVRLLKKENKDVRVIVRKIDESIKNLDLDIVVGSFYDKDILNKSIFEGDIVVHLAALISTRRKDEKEVMKINYDATKIIALHSLDKKVKKFIYVSSTEALDYLGKEYVSEAPDYINAIDIKDPYPKSKILAGNYLKELKKDNPSFNLSIVYPSCVIGTNDFKPSQIGGVLRGIINGTPEVIINGNYNFVDVKDVVNGIYSIIRDDNINGDFILTGSKLTLRELYTIINKTLGKNRLIVSFPSIFAYLLCPFIRVLTPYAIKVLRSKIDYSNQKAKEILNIEFRNIDDTVKDVVDYFIKK